MGAPSARASRAFRLLTGAAALAVLALIALGSVVRVTDSGLGCPDWPLCHGNLLPPLELHALIEYSHRLTASLVVLLVGLATAGAWWWYRDRPGVLAAASLAALFLVVEVVLGAVTVLLELPPAIVTVHLAVAQGIFAFLLVGLVLAWQPSTTNSQVSEASLALMGGGLLFRRSLVAALAAYLLTLSGAYVVAAGATGACEGWPLCGGSLLPSGHLPSIHMLHRLLVVLLGGVILWGLLPAWRSRSLGIATVGALAGGLLAVEIAVGAANPWLGFPAAVRALHLALATALGGSLVILATLAYGEGRRGQQGEAAIGRGGGERRPVRQVLGDYIALTKPWIMALLLLTALGGMVLAAEGLPAWPTIAAVLLGGAFASGGASALNHFLDQDVDAAMERTRTRPVAGHRVSPAHALVFGLALNALAFAILWAGANLLAALLALGGSTFYILVYTGWLKRSTPQNIVIGGAAGAVPPLVGWAAVTGGLGLPALYLFAIIFFWTPPHFWALALLLKRDYTTARIPMLPVVEGEEWTRWAIFLYTFVVGAVTLLLYVTTKSLGLLYLGGAVVLGGIFVAFAFQLLREASRRLAVRVYTYSLLYLALLFLVIMVDSSL